MKRLAKRILGAAAVLLAGAAFSVIIWAVATTQGARWLLESVVPLSGISFTARKIEGKLNDYLLLKDVRIGMAQQNVAIDILELRWKPLLLLAGTIAVQELVINGMHIQDDAPSDTKPLLPEWPRVSETARLLDGKIERLRVTNISYRHLREQPVQVTSLSSSVTWLGGALTISDLKVESTSGAINGSVSANFNQPSLTADLTIAPAQPVAEMDQFSLQVRQSKSTGPEQLAGIITIAGSAGRRKLLGLTGEIGMTRTAINLRKLSLTRPGQKGQVTADGSLSFAALEPVLSLQVTATGLDLAPELNIPTDLSGTLTFAGTVDFYRGAFTFANQGKGWHAATLSSPFQGNRDGVKLALLTGSIVDGTLAGNLDLDWSKGFALRGAISGRNLNPARLDPGWKGVANFNATGNLAWSGKGPVTGSVSGALLESRLHGQALTGDLKADFRGDNVSLARLALQGKGFDLRASGELNRRITLIAQISDVSRLVPGSHGTLRADGWMRWREGLLSGSIAGTGSRLAYAGGRIAAATLTARVVPGPGYPLHVAASLRDVVYDRYLLNAVTLEADGTLPRHKLNAAVRSGGSEARLNLTAGYNAGVWKGEISRLAGRDASGPWNLTAPAAFSLSAGNVSLTTLSISAGASERLEAAVDLTLNPLGGQVRAQWDGVNMARLTPWLPADTRLEGRISGKTKGLVIPGQRFELDGTAVLSGGTLRQERADGELKLTFTSATASWGWRENSFTGALALAMADHGQAKAHFNLPIAARFPIAINHAGPLRASLTGLVQEKGIITTLFPGLVQESFGVLEADLNIGGTWDIPQAGGKLRLTRAGAYLPTAGIHLKDVQLTAHLEKDRILIDSFRAVSGAGHIEGTALITLSGWRVIGYKGSIRGENFQTVHFPELQILSTPNLTFEGTPKKLVLRGDFSIPELHIAGSQSHTVVTPSSDVIREGRVIPPKPDSPLVLDVQVRVLIGGKVFVKVAGIDAQLGGAINLSMSSFDRITSKGEIRVVKGRYRTYGVNLEIVRGRLFFAGGSINNPSLDFLALRTIGNVRAGVTVAGTLQRPITKLYSEPAMPDVDVLAYIVLGHPLGSNSQQASLVAQAAGALLTFKQAGAMREQIKNKLGLSTLEIQGGVGGTPAAMGYKPLQVTPPGAIPARQQDGITETVLTVGKYLTPQLYISYGRSLFTGSNLFLLRYDIFRNWQIETQTGGESGADLYYKMEFR